MTLACSPCKIYPLCACFRQSASLCNLLHSAAPHALASSVIVAAVPCYRWSLLSYAFPPLPWLFFYILHNSRYRLSASSWSSHGELVYGTSEVQTRCFGLHHSQLSYQKSPIIAVQFEQPTWVPLPPSLRRENLFAASLFFFCSSPGQTCDSLF